MPKLNFISVCTDNYSMLYALRLHKRIYQVSSLDLNHYCITDRASELPGFVQPIRPFVHAEGWWNKMNLYCKDMPPGWLLYMDLDIVVQQNFDHELTTTLSNGFPLNAVSDAIGWHGQRFNSSFMLMQSGFRDDIFQKFKLEHSHAIKNPGGDQVWTGPLLRSDELWFIDDAFPNLKKNLKFHLATKEGGVYRLPKQIPPEVKLVDCSGRPKPHELGHLDYIRKNWHEVS